MPIQFRCTGCNQKLAISRRKAGKTVKCPACAEEIAVPTMEEAVATGKLIESPESQPKSSPPKPPPPDKNTPELTPPEPPPPPELSTAEEQLLDDVSQAVFDDLFEEDDLVDEDAQTDEPSKSETAGGQSTAPVSHTPVSHSPVSHKDQDVGFDVAPTATPEAAAPVTAPPTTAASTTTTAPRQWEVDEEEDEDEGFQLHRRITDESGLDMTPMVDVTFLLLIFFMITATFSLQKSMETEAPEPEEEGAAQLPTMNDLADDSVIVEIDEDDSIFVDDVQVSGIGDLVDVLAQKVSGEQKLEMVIDPHPQAKHGTVVQATDAGIEVGMQRIRRVSRKGD